MPYPSRIRQKLFLSSAVAGVAFSGTAPLSAGAAAISPDTNNKTILDIKPPLKFGSHGKTVRHLQSKLKEKNLYNENVDGIYGPNTQAAVVRYQKTKKLHVDGVAGPKTKSSLSSADGKYVPPEKLIQTGDRGQVVRVIQKKLKAQNNYTYRIDGKFGPRTKKAVKAFQSDHELQVDGIVGPQTRAALYGGEQTTANAKLSAKTSNVHTSANNAELITVAKNLQGTPYRWGGESPGGFDCSGFINYVFEKADIHLPRTVSEMWNHGISVDHPQKGDLVFFETYKPGPSHAGIYIGHGAFLSATNDGVKASDMSLDYWQSRYLGSKRITQTH